MSVIVRTAACTLAAAMGWPCVASYAADPESRAKAQDSTCHNYYNCVILAPGTTTSSFNLRWQGVSRQVLIVKPTATPSGKLPALVVLHGDSGTPTLMANTADVPILAAKGYYIILPAAAAGTWNTNPDQPYGSDDVDFVASVVSTVTAQNPIDPTRITLSGFSGGAYLSEILSCQKPTLFNAAAIVAGTMTTPDIRACTPSRPLPTMYVMGTADPVVSYDGSYGQDSAAQNFSYWGGMLGCDLSRAQQTNLPVTVQDGTSVTQQRVTSCTAGGEVDLYTVFNGGHSWPGKAYPNGGFGTVSENLNATLTIGQFASKYTTTSTH